MGDQIQVHDAGIDVMFESENPNQSNGIFLLFYFAGIFSVCIGYTVHFLKLERTIKVRGNSRATTNDSQSKQSTIPDHYFL
jgi:hypothetical protein